jgi:hypothetical protein
MRQNEICSDSNSAATEAMADTSYLDCHTFVHARSMFTTTDVHNINLISNFQRHWPSLLALFRRSGLKVAVENIMQDAI